MDNQSGTAPVPFSAEDRLDSWKSIGAHLHRDTRTVQRWESQGLPIHRRQNSKHGSVYAYKSELDSWWRSSQSSKDKRTERPRPLQESPARSIRPAVYATFTLAAISAVLIGYHFLPHRPQAETLNPSNHTISSVPVAARRITIAILPFRPLQSGPGDISLARTLTENLIKDLQRSSSIRVVDGPSIDGNSRPEDLQTLARMLHADGAVEGSVLHAGKRIRVSAKLVDSSTGSTLWSTQFERYTKDPAAFQVRIADQIAAGIQNSLPAGDR